jgi:hypothetical protein
MRPLNPCVTGARALLKKIPDSPPDGTHFVLTCIIFVRSFSTAFQGISHFSSALLQSPSIGQGIT